jgi:hypothetical protein
VRNLLIRTGSWPPLETSKPLVPYTLVGSCHQRAIRAGKPRSLAASVDGFARVFPVNAPIARVSEIELHLLTIEALSGRVLVRVVGVATDSIREQIAAVR